MVVLSVLGFGGKIAMKHFSMVAIAIGWLVAGVAEPAFARSCSSFVPECKRIVVERCRATSCSKWQTDYAPVDCDRYQQQCFVSGNWHGPPKAVFGVERR